MGLHQYHCGLKSRNSERSVILIIMSLKIAVSSVSIKILARRNEAFIGTLV